MPDDVRVITFTAAEVKRALLHMVELPPPDDQITVCILNGDDEWEPLAEGGDVLQLVARV